jgi:hypothetical protein
MTKLMVAVAVAIALAAIATMAAAWDALGDVEISTAGWLALAGGGVLTFAVGAGLMLLIFYSNRTGFDEQPEIRWPNDADRQETGDFASPPRPANPAKRQTGGTANSSTG